jgi:hypothetical protein
MALSKPTIVGDGFSQIFLGHPERPAVRFVCGTDPDDIASTVIAVMTDPDLRATLGANGHRHVQKLSWARAADETVAVYVSSVADPRARARHHRVKAKGGRAEHDTETVTSPADPMPTDGQTAASNRTDAARA